MHASSGGEARGKGNGAGRTEAPRGQKPGIRPRRSRDSSAHRPLLCDHLLHDALERFRCPLLACRRQPPPPPRGGPHARRPALRTRCALQAAPRPLHPPGRGAVPRRGVLSRWLLEDAGPQARSLGHGALQQRGRSLRARGGRADARRYFGDDATMKRVSPERHARRDATPVLLATCSGDPPALREEHACFVKACRSAGVVCEELDVPDVGHMGIVMEIGRRRDRVMPALSAFVAARSAEVGRYQTEVSG